MSPLAAHLSRLEAEAITIIREVAAAYARPVLLYSIGKDSSVLLHLLQRAFAPARPTIPLLHIDTTWKFQAMYAKRAQVAEQFELRVHINREGLAAGVNPLTHGAAVHTDIMKTQALRQALAANGYDAAIGGARRDEEASRAKERVFSIRSPEQRWDPKRQRPELFGLYNTGLASGETVRVFPLSNWTELDIWLYIRREQIDVVPLYFAAPRPVLRRHGTWLMVDDDRLQPGPGELIETRTVRFRTLGCYPLSGAVESSAGTLDEVIAEMLDSRFSEREGRLIDHDPQASMERKKREGYF